MSLGRRHGRGRVTVEKGIPSLGHHRWLRSPGARRTRPLPKPVGSRWWTPHRTRLARSPPSRRRRLRLPTGLRERSTSAGRSWANDRRPLCGLPRSPCGASTSPFGTRWPRPGVCTGRGLWPWCRSSARPGAPPSRDGVSAPPWPTPPTTPRMSPPPWPRSRNRWSPPCSDTACPGRADAACPDPPNSTASGTPPLPCPWPSPPWRWRWPTSICGPGAVTGRSPRRGGPFGGSRSGGRDGPSRWRRWWPRWRPWPPRGTAGSRSRSARAGTSSPSGAVRLGCPASVLQVDANGSYREEDLDHLAGLDRFGLLCLEQPFAPDDLAGHARLAARSGHADLPRREPRLAGRGGRALGRGVLGGVREAGPARRAGRGPAGRRGVFVRRGAPVDGGHVRVRATPGGSTPPWPRCPGLPGPGT